MKEDILEQAVDDWFLSQESSFTKHNVKFKPDKNDPDYDSRQDGVPSDIDVLAVNLKGYGIDHVLAASCKSWQEGFNFKKALHDLTEDKNKKWGGKRSLEKF